MTLEYIRSHYRVPARFGARVIADGKPATITGTQGQYLLLLVDGEQQENPWHPTWRIKYQGQR